jgi:hypothetical protein
VNHQQMLILKNHARRHAQMKPFFNTQMKAWNQQAAAGNLGLRFETMTPATRFSPRDGFADTRQSFIAGNCFHATAADFIATAKSFRRPESVNLFVLHGIKTLHETVGEQHARLAGQRQRLLGNLFNAQTHDWEIRRKPGKHNLTNFMLDASVHGRKSRSCCWLI